MIKTLHQIQDLGTQILKIKISRYAQLTRQLSSMPELRFLIVFNFYFLNGLRVIRLDLSNCFNYFFAWERRCNLLT